MPELGVFTMLYVLSIWTLPRSVARQHTNTSGGSCRAHVWSRVPMPSTCHVI